VIDANDEHELMPTHSLSLRAGRRLLSRARSVKLVPGPTPMSSPPVIHMFVDETGTDAHSGIVAVACVVLDDPAHVRDRLRATRRAIEDDFHLRNFSSVRAVPEGHLFHFSQDHPEIRNRVLSTICDLPFDAYVALARRPDLVLDADFAWYQRLLTAALSDRVLANCHGVINVTVEQCAPKCESVARQTLQSVVSRVETQGHHFTAFPTIGFAGKDEAALVLPDYVNGVVREVLEKRGDAIRRNYLRMRPRIRLVHDVVRNERYDRKNEMPIPER